MRLHESTGKSVTLSELHRTTRLGTSTLARCLTDLVSAGLAKHDPDADTFTYAPRTTDDKRAVDALSILYNQRPVTLVKLVYEQPPPPVKSFADAFRLRDEDEPGGGDAA